MFRRNLLTASAAIAAGLVGLTACATTGQGNLPQYASDANALANGLAAAVSQLGAMNTLPANLVAQLNTYVGQLQTAANAVVQSANADAAKPWAQQVVDAVEAILKAAAAMTIPPPINYILVAASVLLPVFASFFNLVVPSSALRAGPAMSVDEARLILAGAHK